MSSRALHYEHAMISASEQQESNQLYQILKVFQSLLF